MRNQILTEILADGVSVEIGKKAPDFTLLNHLGERWKLSEQRGKVITLLFYPQNETLVCTRQLCSVRDHWREYLETKAVVVGISPNTIRKHLDFARKYKLPLPLLADESGEITSVYSQHWIMPVNFTRAVIVIDANGIIRSRKVMLRAFRPADRSVIAAIHAARADELNKKYETIAERSRALRNYKN